MILPAPLDGEKSTEYYKRLGELWKVSATAARNRVRRILRRNNRKESIDDIRVLLNESAYISKSSVNENRFDWREALEAVERTQELFNTYRKDTHHPFVEIATEEPICVVLLADLHLCSWATDYEMFKRITDELIQTPGLYAILAGDLLQMAIKLRGVKEVSDNALPPKWQMMFLDSWLHEVYHKILFSTWDNHAVMREEQAVGYSMYQHIFEQYVPYSNGIAHADIKVGSETYKLAVSHFFRGRSYLNPVHGQMRYGKTEGQDREIIMAGDSHVFGIMEYREGGMKKVALNAGSIQNSGYGKRFYSLTNHPEFPCILLFPKEHRWITFRSVSDYLFYVRKEKGST